MTKHLNYMLSRACVFTFLLTLVQHADITQANPDRVCDYRSRPHDEGLCGTYLADTLQYVCMRISVQLPSKVIVKRQTDKFQNVDLRSIMLNRKNALSYLSKRETTSSIICECCHHRCSIDELIQYCDLPGRLVSRFRNSDVIQAAALTS